MRIAVRIDGGMKKYVLKRYIPVRMDDFPIHFCEMGKINLNTNPISIIIASCMKRFL
jgi:hypothetical protein